MFKRKKTRSIQCITLWDASGTALGSWDIRDYPMPESLILELSLRYFNDPEPCLIHRSAVHVRAMVALSESCGEDRVYQKDELTSEQQRCFPEACAALRIENLQI